MYPKISLNQYLFSANSIWKYTQFEFSCIKSYELWFTTTTTLSPASTNISNNVKRNNSMASSIIANVISIWVQGTESEKIEIREDGVEEDRDRAEEADQGVSMIETERKRRKLERSTQKSGKSENWFSWHMSNSKTILFFPFFLSLSPPRPSLSMPSFFPVFHQLVLTASVHVIHPISTFGLFNLSGAIGR